MKKSLVTLFAFLLLSPTELSAQTTFRDTNRRLIEYEETLPYLQSLAGIVCKEGRRLNLDYMSFINRQGYDTLINAVNIATKKFALPAYNAHTSSEKDLLSQVRVSLLIKTMRSVCPDVW